MFTDHHGEGVPVDFWQDSFIFKFNYSFSSCSEIRSQLKSSRMTTLSATEKVSFWFISLFIYTIRTPSRGRERRSVSKIGIYSYVTEPKVIYSRFFLEKGNNLMIKPDFLLP